MRTLYSAGVCFEQGSLLFRLRQGPSKFCEPLLLKEGQEMNDIMGISRSCEKGMYLLREDDCLWRVNQDGMVECAAQGDTNAFELLTLIQQWKTPSRRLLQEYPWQDPSTD